MNQSNHQQSRRLFFPPDLEIFKSDAKEDIKALRINYSRSICFVDKGRRGAVRESSLSRTRRCIFGRQFNYEHRPAGGNALAAEFPGVQPSG